MWRLTLRLALSASLLPGIVSAQLIQAGEDTYRPKVDEHRFANAADRIVSPFDERLRFAGDRPEGTFEFHLTRSWPDAAGADLLYCIAFVGGRKVVPALAESGPDQAKKETAVTGVELADPYAEVTQDEEAPTASATEPNLDDAGRVFWPRYAFYIDNTSFYVQSGRSLVRCELTKQARTRLADRERIYFVVTLRPDRLLVHADGRLCARINEATLASLDGVDPLRDCELDQLVLGTVPNVTLGSVAILKDLDGRLQQQAAAYDLRAGLRNFDGLLGGVRVWSRAFAEAYVGDLGGKPPLAMRGAFDVARQIAFDVAEGQSHPGYADLICASDFLSARTSRHRMRSQQPVSGNWINQSLRLGLVGGELAPGVNDIYCNVRDVPLVTIVPTASRSDWLVYENADFVGLLEANPGSSEGRLVAAEDRSAPVAVTIERHRLTFRLPKAGLLFGGKDWQSSDVVTLERPTLAWLGKPVDQTNPFWNPLQIGYHGVAFKAFDLTKMNPLLAYQEGETGTNRRIFAEPESYEYRINTHKVVVPFSHLYLPVDISSGSSESLLCTTEQDYMSAFSGHVGLSVDTPYVALKADVAKRYRESKGQSNSRFVQVTKVIAKDYALVLNRSQLRLDPAFVSDVETLAARSRSGDAAQACNEFIADWGTHFALGATFGGMMVQERSYTDDAIRTAVEKGLSVEAELVGGLRSGAKAELVGKYEAGVQVGFSKDEAESKRTNLRAEKTSYWLIPGGGTIGSADQSVSAMIKDPVPLFFDLRPLHELFTPANFEDPFVYQDLRVRLRDRTQAYVKAAWDRLPKDKTMAWSRETALKYSMTPLAVKVPDCFAGELHLGRNTIEIRKEAAAKPAKLLSLDEPRYIDLPNPPTETWTRTPQEVDRMGGRDADLCKVMIEGIVKIDTSVVPSQKPSIGALAGHTQIQGFTFAEFQAQRGGRNVEKQLPIKLTLPLKTLVGQSSVDLGCAIRVHLATEPVLTPYNAPTSSDEIHRYMNSVGQKSSQFDATSPNLGFTAKNREGRYLGAAGRPSAARAMLAWTDHRTALTIVEATRPDLQQVLLANYRTVRKSLGLAELAAHLERELELGLPSGTFLVRQNGRCLAADGAWNAVWAPEAEAVVDADPALLLPVRIVNGQLISAMKSFPHRVCDRDGILVWRADGSAARSDIRASEW